MQFKTTVEKKHWHNDWTVLYYRCRDDIDNLKAFVELENHINDVSFNQYRIYWPNYEKAPWHMKCDICNLNGQKVEINFWPHKAKAQIKYQKVVEGWADIYNLISSVSTALNVYDDIEDDEFDVIEE